MKSAEVITLVVVVLLGLGFTTWDIDRADREHVAVAQAALAADNLIAAEDTTRALKVKLSAAGDSLRVVQRRAVQVDRRADALDRALALDRAARDSLSATIASYRATVVADTVRDTVVVAAAGARADTLRRATFDVRQPPYTVHAVVDVAAPQEPDTGRMALTIALDTLSLELRLGCGRANAAGVRPATATVVAPAWASVRLERVEQGPELCASLGATDSRWDAVKRALGRFGISVGYGVGVGAHNVAFSGVAVIAGVRVWP